MTMTQVHLVLGTIKGHKNVQFCHTAQCQEVSTVGLHNRRISAQTVKNCLREAHLRVRRRNHLQWENAHLQLSLARWRRVLFTD